MILAKNPFENLIEDDLKKVFKEAYMDFYTIKDLEEKMGLCRQTIIKMEKDKKNPLPIEKHGRKWRISKENYDNWVKGEYKVIEG